MGLVEQQVLGTSGILIGLDSAESRRPDGPLHTSPGKAHRPLTFLHNANHS